MQLQRLIRSGLEAELAHWSMAAERLGDLDAVATPAQWAALERQTGVVIRLSLERSAHKVVADAKVSSSLVRSDDLWSADKSIRSLRRRYLQTETTLDFFSDAIHSRSNQAAAELLRGTDALAEQSMRRILAPLGYTTPPVLTYIDKGLGASILKAGLRLWDRRTINPVATIKIVRHNVLRPTALLHEAGHQVAHIVGWSDEFADAINASLPGEIGPVWQSWSSEIVADAFAFVNAGFASVASLRNVVDGGRQMVFRFLPGDPHPMAYLRVLLGVQMCRSAFGSGPWDDLETTWRSRYPVEHAPDKLHRFLARSMTVLPKIADLVLNDPYQSFRGQSLMQLIDARVVSPIALNQFAPDGGAALFQSPKVAARDGIRLLALSGYRFATLPFTGKSTLRLQLHALRLLGQTRAV